MTTQQPRTALITGANKGIGFEVARQLAKRGFAVFVGSRDMAKGRAAAHSLCEEGYEATFIQLDLCDPLSIKQAAGTFSQKADRLDVLINNAAHLEDHGQTIVKLNAEMLDRTLTTNVRGTIMVIQDFLPYLEKSPRTDGFGPRIINVTSDASILGAPVGYVHTYAPAYSISKTALNAVTRQFAAALPTIAINCVSPGWVRTDMGGPDAPLSPAEGAETIVWLAADAPASETGKLWRDRQVIDW